MKIVEHLDNQTDKKGVYKNLLWCYLHCKKVWVWDGEEEKARQRTLVIQRRIDHRGKTHDTKYSLSNGELEAHTIKDFAFFQAQRYWVERNFDDGKNKLGMSDYQVCKLAPAYFSLISSKKCTLN